MNPGKLTVALVGARGYAGQVLDALLMHHPCMEARIVDAKVPDPEVLERLADCAAVALAVPEEAAKAWVPALVESGVRALDLSGAHRQIDGIHYGIPELFGAPPDGTAVVANPGCYPTATLLVLKPLLDAGLVEPTHIAVVGLSGTSGAGKSLRDDLHFSELYGNVVPYNVGRHRHVPEIERYLGAEVSFVTELLPIVRGMLVTAFVRPTAEPEALRRHLAAVYDSARYVTVIDEPAGGLGVRHVVGSHQAVLAVGPLSRSGLLPVFSSIDNLMRGAASQALANLNLWLGLPAELGLPPPAPRTPDGVPGMTRMLP